MSHPSNVILVGRQPAAHENLALQYLKGAAQNAGIDVRVLSINGFNEITGIANEIMARSPAVLGLSITDATCAVLLLSLGNALCHRGYRGHITCGGGWATLQRSWLLERHGWLDSIVRFDGEVVLPELVATVVRHGHLQKVAGLTTRKGDGNPAPVHSTIPMNTWPARDELPEILNCHAASLIASRGCMGNCDYCGPAALQRLEREEAIKNNAPYPCGNGRVRRRTVDDITDEMAYLYHKRNVRYFAFADEHLLPSGPQAAHAFLSEFEQQLRHKKVRQYGFSGQINASQITPSLCEALVQAGMVRAHVGIDLIDDGNAFSRPGHVEKQLAAVRLLNNAGIPTVSNVLLLHPYATLASMKSVLDHLKALNTGYVEFTQMHAFAGTAMTEKLHAEGRLRGNPLRYLYTFDNPGLARFEHVFASLRSNGFGRYSIMYRLHEMAYRIALAKRLGFSPAPRHVRALERCRTGAFHLSLQAYSDGIRICEDNEAVDLYALVDAYRMGRKILERALETLENDFNEQIAYVPGASSFTVNAVPLMALLAFGSVTACQDVADTNPDGGSDETATSGDSDSNTDTDTDSDTDTDTDTDTDSDSTSMSLPVCELNSTLNTPGEAAILNAASVVAPCASGTFHYDNENGSYTPAIYGHSGSAAGDVQFELHPHESDVQQMYTKVVGILRESGVKCVPEYTYITGGGQTQAGTIIQTTMNACDSPLAFFTGGAPFATVDNDGKATLTESLLEKNQLTQEEFNCINEVLAELDFSCLTGVEITAETYIIIE